ncbi:MAG: tetratricopeptide repeat protein [Ignavibacteriales bacterium]|nr:tetratricopeptide repeat protein [Ignavibacteriales bacterium]HOJ18349.1 tetratricopeptide repeat protein [Ignavibacteriaceae bacterium]
MNNKFLLARSYEQAGDLKKACEIYEDVYAKQPDNLQFFSSLNNIYVLLKNYDGSVKLLKSRIEKTPADVSLYGLLGVTYFLSGSEREAEQVWENAASKFNNDAFLRTLAGYALNVRAFDIAIKMFQKAKISTTNQVFYAFELANLYSITMQYKNAAEELAFVVIRDPAQIFNVESRIYPYLSKPDALNSFISVFEKNNPEQNMNFAHLLGILYTEAKQYDDAFNTYKLLDEVQKQQGNELLNFAQRVQNSGDINTALKVYDYLLANYTSSPMVSSIKLSYAKTLEASLESNFLANNDLWKPVYRIQSLDQPGYLRLIESYMEIINLYPNSESAIEAILRIALIYDKRLKMYPEAEKNYSMITKNYPMSRFYLDAVLNHGILAIKKGDINDAETLFDNTFLITNNSNPNFYQIKYYRALCYFYKSDIISARTILDSLSKKINDNIANDALELLVVFNSSLNDSINLLRLADIEFRIFMEDFDNALNGLLEISNSTPSFLLRDYVNFRIAELLTANDDYNKAVQTLQLTLENNPENIYSDKILFFMSEIFEYGLKDYSKATSSLEKLLMNYPDSIYSEKCREKILQLKRKTS